MMVVPAKTSPNQQIKNIMWVHLKPMNEDSSTYLVSKLGWYSEIFWLSSLSEGEGFDFYIMVGIMGYCIIRY